MSVSTSQFKPETSDGKNMGAHLNNTYWSRVDEEQKATGLSRGWQRLAKTIVTIASHPFETKNNGMQ